MYQTLLIVDDNRVLIRSFVSVIRSEKCCYCHGEEIELNYRVMTIKKTPGWCLNSLELLADDLTVGLFYF